MNLMSILPISLIMAASLIVMPSTAEAAESFENCVGFVDSLPANISKQGTWCLRKDLGTSISTGAAITISVPNVTLDCNGFKIGGLGAGPTTAAYGIEATERANTTIRNCSIRGFNYGIVLDSEVVGGHLIEDNRFDGNTYTAMYVAGDGSMIRNNLVIDTGGGTGGAVGIQTVFGVDIIGNTISGVLPAPDRGAYGIVTFNSGASISHNRIRGLVTSAEGQYAIARGISNNYNDGQLTRISLVGNELIGPGTAQSHGIICNSESDRVRDNIINGFAFPLTNGVTVCGDAGGNDIYPTMVN